MKSAKSPLPERFKGWIKKLYYKHKPVDKRDAIRLVVLAIAIPVFLYSAGQLIYKLYRYRYEDREMEKIVELKPDDKKNPFDDIDTGDNIDQEASQNLPYEVLKGEDSYLTKDGILADYEELKGLNEDLAGWIYFPGYDSKPIDYPILYSGDNSFYLHRDFNKNDSYAGSIFFDGSNDPYHEDPLEIDRNYVIYGHAMKNKSMFGYLTDFWKYEESWDKTTIYIDLMNTRLEYEIISTFLCDPDYNYRQTRFASDEQYLSYLNEMVERSAYDFGAKVSAEDKIITLSTCYRSTRRTAVIAKLVRQITYTKRNHGNLNDSSDPDSVAIPTHLPFEVPTPTPRPTVTPTPEISQEPSVSPSGQPSPEPTSEPEELLNLILDPGFEDEEVTAWQTNPIQEFEKTDLDINSGSFSGHVQNDTEENSLIFQDVTDILLDNGSGRYSAGAFLKSIGISADYKIMLKLELKKEPVEALSSAENSNIEESSAPETTAAPTATPDPDPEDETVKIAYYCPSSVYVDLEEWTYLGGEEMYLTYYPEEGDPTDIVSWDGYELINAVLVFFEVEKGGDGFFVDDVSFYKEGVLKPTPTPTATPEITEEPESTVTPEISATPEITEEPEVSVTPEITEEPESSQEQSSETSSSEVSG